MRSFEDRIKEDQTGSTFKAINKRNLSNFYFPLPPLAEQHRIVQRIETLFAEVDELEEKLNLQTKLDKKLQLAVNAEVQKAPDADASKSAWRFISTNFETLYHTPEAIDNLKKNILNEAVRGRLVAQNPNDEPASELLEKVDSAKMSKEDLPFEIPENWTWCFYKDVAELRHGHQFRKYDYVKDGVPVIKIGQCKPDGSLDLTNCNYIEHSRKEEFKDYLINEGDLLMALTGGTLGKVTRVDKDYGVIVQNYRVGNFIPQSSSLTLDYLNVILESELFQGLVRKKINQNAQPNIGKSSIEQILMPIPPLEEQHRIVQCIEELFAICDQFKAQLEQRQAVNERLMKGLVGEVLEGS
jgi:type I restriction enzyme S subunit